MITIQINRPDGNTRDVIQKIWEIKRWFLNHEGIKVYQFYQIDEHKNKKLIAESYMSFLFEEDVPAFGEFIERVMVHCPNMSFYEDRHLLRTPDAETRDPYEWTATFEDDSLAVQFKLAFL